MFDLILGVAKGDERIRAVYMNGSRTNPNAPRDLFQDYDIVYAVTETASFLREPGWVDVFGERLIMQEPDRLDLALGNPADFDRGYAYLMLLADGNRIDLTLQPVEVTRESYVQDKLTVPLLDKDGLLPAIPAPSDEDYHVQRPTAGMFEFCTNEFWWCLQNAAKGLWRDELPYARSMFELTSRQELDRMAEWWIGMRHGYRLSAGKMGKYFKTYLRDDDWRLYERTLPGGGREGFWDALFAACELFRKLGIEVAAHGSFVYPDADDAGMTAYLERVRSLPPDAKAIF